MAVYSDDFAGTGAVSGNWAVTRNSLSRDAGNLVGGSANDYNNMLWSANSFAAAQYSQMVIAASNSFYCNVSVRASGTWGAGTWSHYCLVANPGSDFRLERWVNNSQTSNSLVSLGTPPANGDTVQLEIDANYNLSVYVNGSLRATYNDTSTPTALASGSVGCGCYSTNSRIESWEGGDITTGTASPRSLLLLGIGR